MIVTQKLLKFEILPIVPQLEINQLVIIFQNSSLHIFLNTVKFVYKDFINNILNIKNTFLQCFSISFTFEIEVYNISNDFYISRFIILKSK